MTPGTGWFLAGTFRGAGAHYSAVFGKCESRGFTLRACFGTSFAYPPDMIEQFPAVQQLSMHEKWLLANELWSEVEEHQDELPISQESWLWWSSGLLSMKRTQAQG